jgi:hypothetical protein
MPAYTQQEAISVVSITVLLNINARKACCRGVSQNQSQVQYHVMVVQDLHLARSALRRRLRQR